MKQRDEKTGQYTERLEAVCKCGHTKGVHTAGGYDCQNGSIKGGSDCDCAKFKKARVSK